MSAKIVKCNKGSITVEVTIKLAHSSMLESEESILTAVNEVGTLVTGFAIEQFDTNGSPIIGRKLDKFWSKNEDLSKFLWCCYSLSSCLSKSSRR